MRGTAVKVVSLAAALTLLSGASAWAQLDEPLATPPPPRIEGVTMAVVQSDINDPAIIEAVSSAARFAFKEIGGELEGKKAGYDTVVLPDTRAVVRAVGDAAQREYGIVVVDGGDSQSTVGFASSYPATTFIDIDQTLPCVTADGRADPSGTCEGTPFAIPFNYTSVDFDVDQAAYMAGVVAASASRDDVLGVISGTADCAECSRIIEGFTLGAASLKPEIDVEVAYLSDQDGAIAFDDPTSAKTFARAFIDVYEPDVLLSVAGSGSRGIIEAACEAGILAVGTDIDVSEARPDLEGCILASITKDFEYAVREAVFAVANGTQTPEQRLGLANGHVSVTDEWTRLAGMPVDLAERYAAAEQAVITGQVRTCVEHCARPAVSTLVTEPEPEEDVLASPAAEASPAGE